MNLMQKVVKPKAEYPGEDPYGCDLPHEMDNRVSSATDFTGLIPSGDPTESELESYAELYHYPGSIKNTE